MPEVSDGNIVEWLDALIHAAKEEAEAERDMLQDILDERPAINAGLPDSYIRWSQAIYSGDFVRAIMAAKEEEREECAKIADGVPETVEGFYTPGTVITIWSVTSAISAAIRNRKLANNTNKD